MSAIGPNETEPESMLTTAGFTQIEVSIVDKPAETANFQTLLAIATKP